jgi:hypothetical protein
MASVPDRPKPKYRKNYNFSAGYPPESEVSDFGLKKINELKIPLPLL